MRDKIIGLMFGLIASGAIGQNAEPTLTGTWKYLRTFQYVHLDEQNRAFQCRMSPDMHIFFATGAYQADDGIIEWDTPRFFSLYGQEVASGQEWGRNPIELRNRVMFLTVPMAYGQGTERLEFDKVPVLPTICAHYLAMAFE